MTGFEDMKTARSRHPRTAVRSARRKGEVDLIGWEGDTLCFIEVKTRSSREFRPAEASVDFEKQRELRIMSREYRRMIKRAASPVAQGPAGTPAMQGIPV